jgi:uncharacterized membrane protein (DUF441 family)
MYDGTVRMLNALAVLGVVASPLVTVFVFIVEKAEQLPPPAFPFMLLTGLTISLVLRSLAILVHVAADTRRRVAEAVEGSLKR